jgi:hypothetical protein
MIDTLQEFLTHLNAGPRIYRPDDEAWDAMIARIGTPETVAEVSEETYAYFLEVLPPHYQSGGLFAFAEGLEPLCLFWRGSDKCYWVRQLTWSQTRTFCRLANIRLPS